MSEIGHVVMTLKHVDGEIGVVFGLTCDAVECFERRLDVILLDNAVQLSHQVSIQLVVLVELFLGSAAIVDANLLVGVVQLPGLALVLFVKVDHKEWVLKVDEEVAHVGLLFGFLLVRDNVYAPEHIFVRLANLVLQLLLAVAARDVFHAKIRPQILAQLDLLHLDGLVEAASIRLVV